MLLQHARPDPDTIMQIMSNLAGVQNQLFPSDQTIKIVVGRLVHQYKDPLKQSAVLIAQILRTLVDKASRQVNTVEFLR